MNGGQKGSSALCKPLLSRLPLVFEHLNPSYYAISGSLSCIQQGSFEATRSFSLPVFFGFNFVSVVLLVAARARGPGHSLFSQLA